MTWEEFRELFMGKFFPASTQHAKAQEFLKLKQGTMIVLEYVAKFIELTRFADDYVATYVTPLSPTALSEGTPHRIETS